LFNKTAILILNKLVLLGAKYLIYDLIKIIRKSKPI
jgi:threonine/homoserine/homoserine lactone efflux protein